MSIITNRRSFLFGASVAGFGIFAQGRRGWARGVGPNETLNIACIGVGGKGESDTKQAGASRPDRGRVRHRRDSPGRDGRIATRKPRNTTTTASCCTSLIPRSTPSSSRRPTTRTPRPP